MIITNFFLSFLTHDVHFDWEIIHKDMQPHRMYPNNI